MRTSWQKLKRFLADDSGPTAVEYAFLIALIFLACLIGIQTFGEATAESFSNSSNSLNKFIGS